MQQNAPSKGINNGNFRDEMSRSFFLVVPEFYGMKVFSMFVKFYCLYYFIASFYEYGCPTKNAAVPLEGASTVPVHCLSPEVDYSGL